MLETVSSTKTIDSLKKTAKQLHQDLDSGDKTIKFHGDLNHMMMLMKKIQIKTNLFVDQPSVPNVEQLQNSVQDITHSMVRSCSSILDNSEAWESGGSNKTEMVRIAEDVLQYIQFAGITLGCTEAKAHPNATMDNRMTNPAGEVNRSNIFLSAFNMDSEQPIQFAYAGLDFSLTDSIDNETFVSDHCNHKIGVGAVFDKLSKYLSFNLKESDRLIVNSEVVAFNYNNRTETFHLPGNTFAQMR